MTVPAAVPFSRLCDECPIRSITFCQAESKGDAASRVRPGFRVCRKGRPIYRQGDIGGEIYTLREGWAFRFMVLPDGRRQILDFLLRGDPVLLPLLFVPRLPYGVQALTDTILCTFPLKDVTELREQAPAFARRLDVAGVNALIRGESRLADINLRNAKERTAWLLLSLYRDLRQRGFGGDRTVPFPPRLSHIADALGLTVTHVSRTLGALRRDGVVSLSADKLTVHHEQELAAIAALPRNDDRGQLIES